MKEWEKALSQSNSVFVTDFDGTLTTSGSSMHAAARILGSEAEFSRMRDALYQQYGKKVLKMMKEESENGQRRSSLQDLAQIWWEKQMELYVKKEIKKDILYSAAGMLPARVEGLEILRFCLEEEIPVWIVSAGIKNVIEFWLERHEFRENRIQILANQIYYENEKPVGHSPVVTICNKAQRFFESAGALEGKKLVQLGNRQEDIGWKRENTEEFLIGEEGCILKV